MTAGLHPLGQVYQLMVCTWFLTLSPVWLYEQHPSV